MVGARRVHVTVTGNVFALLKAHLKGTPCRTFASDMLVRVEARDSNFYPDVFVTCDEGDKTADRVMTSPKLLVEVLSESTRRIDDGEKREAYLTIPSLTHYILLEQSSIGAVVYERGSAGFERRVLTELTDSIPMLELNISLSLAAVYDGIEFSDE